MAFRKYLPKSLFWRAVLIVVAPMVILQGVLAYLIIQRHYDGVTRQMTEGVALELSYVLDVVDHAAGPAAAEAELARASRTLNYPIELQRDGALPPDARPLFFDVIGQAVESELRDRVDRRLFVAIDPDEKIVDIRAATRHGVVRAQLPRRRMTASNPHLLLTWMGATAAGLIAVSLVYLRNQIRPIRALADAADAFGKGRISPLRVSGAEEVRRATAAFLHMRERIERQIEQRTRMLSGVSHDMRTPLTRMKLALAMMEESPELDALRSDVEDLERILEEFLAYARGDHGESFEETDALALAREVVGEARRKGADVALIEPAPGGDTVLKLRPNAIKRTLHNLLENAASYGETASLSLTLNGRYVEFTVEDDGPGIPPERRADAFRPFSRLDEARNQNHRSGVGLGLALALDAVRGHGGDIHLSDSERLGGLRAAARLPR